MVTSFETWLADARRRKAHKKRDFNYAFARKYSTFVLAIDNDAIFSQTQARDARDTPDSTGHATPDTTAAIPAIE